RLAVAVGQRVETRFPGGVLLIRLVGAGNEADVLATLASAVGVDDNIGDLDHLRVHLSDRPSLLIIDNCEHVIGAVRRFVGQEGGGPLQVLATSRTTLGLPGERVWRLQPLEVPDAAGTDQDCASVRLLADRVSAADASFSLDSTDTGDLSRLCRRAGGIPLALELTARWVPVVGLDGVADLTLESVPNQESPLTPHHVSLARAIVWSVETLAPRDKEAFEAASLFNGSFSLDGLWSVCLPDHSRREAARTVASLTDASLLTVERPESGPVRYRMLEPLREHAKAGLSADSLGLIRERHAAHFVERAVTIEDRAKGPGEAATFREIDEEIADFRAAMRHLLDGQRHADAALIAASLGRYWFVRYLGSEAQRWFSDALEGELDPHVRLAALSAAGWAAYGMADYEQAESRYHECLELARTAGDRGREGEALYGLARIHLPRRSRSGEALLGQALSIFDSTGAELQAAECRLWLGLRAANAGQVPAAIEWLNESITVLERFGYLGLLSVAHRYLSLAAWYAADESSARRHLELAESTARAAGDRRALGGALIQRGMVEGRWGDTDVAAAAITEALAPIPDNRDIDFCLIAFGAIPVLIKTRRWRVAGRLLAHLDRIYEEYGWTPLEERLPVTADFRSKVETGLTDERLSVAFDPVSSMTMAADLTGELAEIAHG
ncbi:MAG: ATP-binding protein, partial [Acidimicrobiia bacterium]